ncbi:MAG: DUF1573 domain-containing protein [Bacteroidia bacterium]
MKKLILFSLILLATAGVSTAQTATTTTATTATKPDLKAPEMKFDKMEYDFGKITQGDVATHEFTFKNVGKSPLIINQAQGSCGCTVPEWPKEPIKPGAKGVIKVTFNSAHKSGVQDKTVTITSNAKEEKMVLHMKGEVIVPVVDAPVNTTPANTEEKK